MATIAATYDAALSTDKDWVRLLIGDSDVDAGANGNTKAQLFDAEITALLAAERSNGLSGGESSQVYLAAARALELLATRWMAQGKGIVEKRVGQLQIRRSDNESADELLKSRISSLRKKGADLLMPRPRMFRTL